MTIVQIHFHAKLHSIEPNQSSTYMLLINIFTSNEKELKMLQSLLILPQKRVLQLNGANLETFSLPYIDTTVL